MAFTLFDGLVAVVILISAVLAMVRGFVREVLSVASWVAAAVAAYYFYDDLTPILEPYINEDLAIIISAGLIFFIVLVIATYLTMKIADFVIDSRVGAVDRLLGFAFGALRGLLLVVIAYYIFSWLVDPEDQPGWIASAQSTPILTDLGDKLVAILPEEVQETLRRDDEPPAETPTPAANTGNQTPPPAASDPFGDRFGDQEPALNYDQNGINQLLGSQQQPAP